MVELLTAISVTLIILVVVLAYCDTVDRAWRTAGADPFADAQAAFETIAYHLQHATLETYPDYVNASGSFRNGTSFIPDHLARRSDLAFACGPASTLLAASKRITAGSAVFFVTPRGTTSTLARTGAQRLLNATGYFIEFGDDNATPFFMPQTHAWRWRLKEVLQSSESLQAYATTTSAAWFQPLVATGVSVPILADNVIALVFLPERAANDSGAALAPTFAYDSRDTTNTLTLHQLPPRVRVALVAIDPVAAVQLAASNGTNPPALVSASAFQGADKLDADLAALDTSLTQTKINHRVYERDILLDSAAWTNTASR
jgi:uncharacterized protein (TIGR02599 family)